MDLSIISLRETKSPEDIVNDVYQKQIVNPTLNQVKKHCQHQPKNHKIITTTGQEISDIETNSNCAQQVNAPRVSRIFNGADEAGRIFQVTLYPNSQYSCIGEKIEALF
ncbi:hypothetical protein BpHYR1_047451 [Brachionus plicatilis]|uniref:Uncharacterized protein n=1 Tax=Brachionus plicatilis TaxID=10195 RepID=A0A3M7PS17_BRAPC|nr:hypothetical protein BpHYR1_047451 [Brachionus plicatilis]